VGSVLREDPGAALILDRGDVRNVAALLVAQAVAALVGVFAFTRIGRELQVRELGRFGFALSSTAFFGLLAEFGIRYAAMREIALNPGSSGAVYRHAARARWLLAGATLVFLLLVASLRPWRGERDLLMLAGLVAVTQFGSDAASWVFFGRGRVDLGAVVLVVDRLLYLVGIYVAAFTLPTAEGLVLGALGANLVRMGVSKFWMRAKFGGAGGGAWEPSLFLRMLTGGAAIGVAILVFVGYSQVSVVLMKAFSTPEELGYYAMAFGIVSVLLVIPTSLTMALFPTLAARLDQGEETRRELLDWNFRLNLTFALPLAALLFLFPDALLGAWMGVKYAPASLTLRILSVVLVLSTLSFMYRLFFFASNRYRWETALNLIGVSIMIVLGVPICRAYGGVGVAALLVTTECLIVFGKVLGTRRWLGSPPILGVFVPGVLAVAIPGCAAWLADGLRWSLRAGILAVGAGVLLVVFKVVPIELWRVAKGLLRQPGSEGAA